MSNAEKNAPIPNLDPTTLKKAVGVETANRTEVLALATLFIGEGRRDRRTLLTHLLLMDLIEDEVPYGTQGLKSRSLNRAVDIPKPNGQLKAAAFESKITKYNTSNLGDSPMAHEGSVLDSHRAGGVGNHGPSRYLDKTISLVVQWVAAYYTSSQFSLEPCKPADARPAELKSTHDTYAENLAPSVTKPKKKSEKAGVYNRRLDSSKDTLLLELKGVPNQILAMIEGMFLLRLDSAKVGHQGDADYRSLDKTVDTSKLTAANAKST